MTSHSERFGLCLVERTENADEGGMESPTPIYLQSCGECGRPALTLNEEGEARCAEHAAVFIPAEDAAHDEDGADQTW